MAVATSQHISIKFAVKTLADFTVGERVHVVDGSIRVCQQEGEGR